ncbi:hypothetical protein FB565_000766 [Actinoplanes lutulentus]|uniref:Uncharacterized protein n=1 Tax=Actinoplanes lutulentus TaxID=1287878 RepID=A0A327ZLW9_9ACTN|nr:hypothetical protein [Actinoplanes lutulentus]MBB2941062.1 hypothetical protein [Actinoplanes lutulentus]RAK43371.1 hypothetical protein B0I29_101501 [Actinoplanes lutulentus]
MTYYMFLLGGLHLVRLKAALARYAGVTEDEVDISVPDDMERNWQAAVLCTYEPADGDITWSLDIYLRDVDRGDEALAEQLARGLGEPVLYSAQNLPPSAHWLVEADGSRTRARVYEADDEVEALTLTIDAVERPVAALPNVRVEVQPEVIRHHRMTTPVVDGLRMLLADEAEDPAYRDALWEVLNGLVAWEAMTVRMASGWPPDGWYPFEYWQEDLGYRDSLAVDIGKLPHEVAETLNAAVGMFDEDFRAGTAEISGVSPEKAWWWHRAPEPPPWIRKA